MFLSVPVHSWTCEPIIPLAQLLAGSSLVGPAFFTQSIVCLCVAVAVKCAVFAYLEPRLARREAVVAMLFANVISTVPGLLVAAIAASLSGVLLAFPIIFGLGCLVGPRIARAFAPQHTRWSVGAGATLGFLGFFFVSVWTFLIAQGALEGRSYGEYWVLKFLFVALSATTGIVISAVIEEYFIARILQRRHGELLFYRPVARANYVTLGLILLVAALITLPKRLSSPNFILSWFQTISGVPG